MTEIPEFVDDHPERDFANSERLAYILKLTARQVRRLAADRIIPREADGTFHILRCSDAYIAYKTAPRPAASEALDRRQTELLERRLQRADKEEIEMSDALETIDEVTSAFLMAIDMVEAEVLAKTTADPEKVRLATAQTRATLAERFAGHRLDLEEGTRK